MIDEEVANLSDYFAVFNSLLTQDEIFWFRGHADLSWQVAPSALRPDSEVTRNRALSLLPTMKRYLEIKLSRPPAPDEDLKWIQIGQHYGLPTRLLDWTQSAAVALYFACDHVDTDGLVLVLNPVELNRQVDAKRPRVFDADLDADIITPYLQLTGKRSSRGRQTIAIHPTWNTERILLQQGFFTLHGSRNFSLDRHQAPSLVYVPILREVKESLRKELERIGIGEMFIFPEPEHVCRHLRRGAGL